MSILTKSQDKGYIYVCGFSDQTVKIGHSKDNPAKTIHSFDDLTRETAKIKLAHFWVSEPHAHYQQSWQALNNKIDPFKLNSYISDCCKGIDYLDLVGFASSLVTQNGDAA